MNIEDFSRLLREAMNCASAIEAGRVMTLVDQHEAGFDLVQERILDLVRKRAGIVPIAKGDSPPQRLNSLRLGTTYPGVRQAALRKLVLDNEDQIADLAGRLLSVRLKRDLALAELEMEAARSQEVKEARAERRRDKLYAEVAAAADYLHEAHGVTCHHWKAAGEEQLAAIAAVLWQAPAGPRAPQDEQQS
jgi:hypothetical protein